MTYVRYIAVENLSDIGRAMDRFPEIVRDNARQELYNVLTKKPRTMLLKRIPLARTARYAKYIRKDGRVTPTRYPGVPGTLRTAGRNPATVNGDGVTFGIRGSSRLIYAAYAHERTKPGEGEYWSEGQRGHGRGWTTKGTGNKFVQMPVETYADLIPELHAEAMDRHFREAGL